MRLINKDATIEEIQKAANANIAEHVGGNVYRYTDDFKGLVHAVSIVEDMPEVEGSKDLIQRFHDYQVEWLTSHCDIEFVSEEEELIIRFLHDTANCFMMEMERGEQNE